MFEMSEPINLLKDRASSVGGFAPHILLVVDQFPKALGGGERIVLRLASLLPNYGFRVSILTFAIHPDCSVLRAVNCPVYMLPITQTYGWKALRAAVSFERFLREQNVKLVQTFFETSDIWAGAVVKMFSEAKLIWSRRDMGILRTRKHWIAYRVLGSLPDRVFAVAEEVRRLSIETDCVDPERVTVVYNGLELSSGSTLPQPRERCIVATVGNLRHVKGHDVLVRAASLVLQRFPNCVFRVAGEVLEPEYECELRRMVQDLDISNNFHLVGAVTDLHAYLSQATVFVLPSRSEGFSNAIIEAMSESLPVVATDVGGNSEAITHGETGFIVASEDVEALAERICQLLADPDYAANMGAKARVRVQENFSTEAMMVKITQAYRSLLDVET